MLIRPPILLAGPLPADHPLLVSLSESACVTHEADPVEALARWQAEAFAAVVAVLPEAAALLKSKDNPDTPRFAWSPTQDERKGFSASVYPLSPDLPERDISTVLALAEAASLRKENGELRDEVDAARERVYLADVTQSIAHKNNNQLGILTGYMAILRDDPALPPETRDRLQIMDHALQAMSRYNRGLTRVIKRLNPRITTLRLAALLENVRERFEATLGSPVAWEVRLPEETVHFQSEPHHLQTALLAILQNAWESYPERLQERPLAIEGSLSNEEPGIQIVVTDQGRGMPNEFLEVAWDPFVTTKSDPEAGLGLTIARHLVRQVGGSVEMVSSPGRGTSVTLFVPATVPSGVEQGPRAGAARAT